MYAKCGLIEESQAAFDNLLVQDVLSWMTLNISGYAEYGSSDGAMEGFRWMQCPNIVTLMHRLKASGCVEKLRKVWRYIH